MEYVRASMRSCVALTSLTRSAWHLEHSFSISSGLSSGLMRLWLWKVVPSSAVIVGMWQSAQV